jgi:SpoVK/Ycf46/Vps4 family AAA+-type ATPase
VNAVEHATFLPGAGCDDRLGQYWLRQVTARLRREVCWLWRERLLQGVAQSPPADATSLPPFVDGASSALDLVRYERDKRLFFAEDVTARHLSERIAEAAPHDANPKRGTLGWTQQELELEPAAIFVLALALLPAVDSSAGPVIAACLNDPQRHEPTLALAQRLWDEPGDLLSCFDADHALYTHGLLDTAPTSWNQPLQVSPLVARELLLPEEAAPRSPVVEEPRRRVIPVLGAEGAPLAEAAAEAAARVGLELMRTTATPAAAHLRSLLTVAWLRGAALYMPIEALSTSTADSQHAHETTSASMPLPELPLSLFVGMHDSAAIRRLGALVMPAIRVPPPTHAARLEAWQRAVPSAAHRPVLAELARRFRCETSAIERIGAELALLGREPTSDELLAASRADLDLGALAQPVAPRFKLSELTLPAKQDAQIAELVKAMTNLGRAHYDWGTARAWNEAGIAALFAGPPGTGKTMASEAIASELQLPLFRIDLSQVVNKYIGETEKNLKRLFDAADAADAILFFDEADALFGKRTEVKDAHDRYANLEISYLLERMERFKGLAILATNRRRDLDEAFLRRLRFVIEFPLPGARERQLIWRNAIPDGVATDDLDFEFLGQRFALAGGHIRAIVLHACLQHASEGAPRRLTMDAIIRAVQREYDKLERPSSPEQFGRYASLITMTGGGR